MVLGLAAATASISASWPFGSVRSGTSAPSVVHWLAKTMAMSHSRAIIAASDGYRPFAKLTRAPPAARLMAASGAEGW